MFRPAGVRAVLLLGGLALAACAAPPGARVVTVAASAVGAEAEVLRRQIEAFERQQPSLRVELRVTPDAADQRHQLYVQWLNAHAPDPDLLQLDVVWTPEFAAAGWIDDLDDPGPPADDFFPEALAANRWNGRLFALPWFVDVGMLYWRTDIVPHAPANMEELERLATEAQARRGLPFGLVWQGARYEGLVTVFLEYLGAFGGTLFDSEGRVSLGADAAVDALRTMRDHVDVARIVPPAALTWHEEQTRFAFQNGEAAFMRNWPYAVALLQDDAQSKVANRFAVAPMPSGPGGAATAALGGGVLAVNAHSDEPEGARLLLDYLLKPEQLIERARDVGQFPPRPSLYDTPELADALTVAPGDVRRIIERAVARPATPIYAELSETLQVALHRVLTRQEEPRAALVAAAAAMQARLDETGLGTSPR